MADALGLSVTDVETALAYWAAHRREVDQLIEHRESDQDTALRAWEQRQPLRTI